MAETSDLPVSEVIIIQHIACEPPGTIADALTSAGHVMRLICVFEGEPVPTLVAGASGLVVMGGPMGVYEQSRYPFLTDELRLIEDALAHEVPILGVCLGSQLLAAALGGSVQPAPHQEIGWYPLSLTDDAAADPLWRDIAPGCMAFHWHGDQFSLPPGAVALASSDLTPHQAFRYGRATYGLQCHLEVTGPMIEDWIETFGDGLRDAGMSGQELLVQTHEYLGQLNTLGNAIFRRWAALIAPLR